MTITVGENAKVEEQSGECYTCGKPKTVVVLSSDKMGSGNDELGGYTYRFTRTELFVKLCMVICNVFYYGCMLLAIRGIFVLRHSSRLSACLLPPLYMLGAHAGTYAGRGLKPVPLLDNSRHHNIGRLCTGRQ